MKMKTFYTEPKIVRFVQPFEDGELDTIVGLAVGDKVVCACCGGVFYTCDVIALAESGFDIQYEEFDWFDFSEYLILERRIIMGYSCAEVKNEKVYICFDNDGYEVVGVYTDKSDAQKHMIKAYVEELRARNEREDIDFNDIAYDLETMLSGYIENLFYIEEHEVKTSFEQGDI